MLFRSSDFINNKHVYRYAKLESMGCQTKKVVKNLLAMKK
ncbi:MAG: hypothetical protein K0S63_184 [Gammaproteobacteria bacterium]|jgi:hypothetical protein|nr:hypothetical protein [Gammaproteobacteria bacterium]